ncbi:MAG: PDDEXK nuclease domain-containing protein [Bacteroidota bacterium]
MSKTNIHPTNPYAQLLDQIEQEVAEGRKKAVAAINQSMVAAYWNVGRHIVQFEQDGKARADYGSKLLHNLSQDLTARLGSGFSHSNINYMRMFFLEFPILETASPKLSWGHWFEILKISDPLERSFFQKQTEIEGWGVRELKRQKNSLLFHRIASSKDKSGVLKLAQTGQLAETPEDILRDPFVLEFLKMPEPQHWHESHLEERLISQLQQFLLELGKGFAFVGRQYKIQVGGRFFHVDLVFYHRILKCFVLIDLKKDEVEHSDIGQMNFYLNYFREEENTTGDNEPIGIILAREKHELVVRYAMGNLNANLFVAKYQLYLPERAELEQKLKAILEDDTKGLQHGETF